MKELIQSIINIQSELKAPKNQFNKFGGYHYRSQEDILNALKPLLLKEKVFLSLTDHVVYIEGRFYIQAVAKISDGENSIENTAYAREVEVKKGMDGSQVTGGASSYARKYALNGLFLIDDAKDADTDEHKKETKPEPDKEVLKTISEIQENSDLEQYWKEIPGSSEEKKRLYLSAFQKRKAEILKPKKK